mgnify:FL=1|jgi:uncharacterized membrane protein YdbT with pleckstrin-like domain
MGYIEDNLMDEESVVLNTRLHPIVLLVPAMSTSFLAGSLWYYPTMFPNNEDGYIALTIILVLLAYSAYRLCDRLIVFVTSEFAVTSKRVLGKTGFIRRKSLDIVLAKVEAIRLTQSILGRILDYGDIEVTGTGGTEEILEFIPAPLEFRKAIQEQLSEIEGDANGERAS